MTSLLIFFFFFYHLQIKKLNLLSIGWFIYLYYFPFTIAFFPLLRPPPPPLTISSPPLYCRPPFSPPLYCRPPFPYPFPPLLPPPPFFSLITHFSNWSHLKTPSFKNRRKKRLTFFGSYLCHIYTVSK